MKVAAVIKEDINQEVPHKEPQDMDYWLELLTKATNRLLAVRREAEELEKRDDPLSKMCKDLTKIFDNRKTAAKDLQYLIQLLEMRFGENSQVNTFLDKVAQGIKKLVDDLDSKLVKISKETLMWSIKDLMDESFASMMDIQNNHKTIFTRDCFLDVLMSYIKTRQEDQGREDIYMDNQDQVGAVTERYKTVILKLKRHNVMYSLLKERMHKFVRNFRKSLDIEALQAIPMALLSNADGGSTGNYSIMTDPMFQLSEPKIKQFQAVSSSTDMFNSNKNNMANMSLVIQPGLKDKEEQSTEDFFPTNIKLFRAYNIDNEVTFFARLSNLMLYQIEAKTKAAIELYNLEEVISSGLKEFLKVLSLPASQRIMTQQPHIKKLVVQRLSCLFYSIGKSVLGKTSTDNEIGMYNVVAQLFVIEKKLRDAFTETKDLQQLYCTKIDSFFAITLKRFIVTIREKSNYFYEIYLKEHLDNFKKLDIFSRQLNELLSDNLDKKLEDGSFYRLFNQTTTNRSFFQGSTAKQHYMVPFHFILQRVTKDTKGSILWSTKAALFELLQCLIKRKKFINFLGYFSLLLNLDAFISELVAPFDVKFKAQIGSIGELRFLKHFFCKLVISENQHSMSKKSSTVYAANKKVKVSHDIIDRSEGMTYGQLMETKAEKLEVLQSFDIEDYYEQISLNNVVC